MAKFKMIGLRGNRTTLLPLNELSQSSLEVRDRPLDFACSPPFRRSSRSHFTTLLYSLNVERIVPSARVCVPGLETVIFAIVRCEIFFAKTKDTEGTEQGIRNQEF